VDIFKATQGRNIMALQEKGKSERKRSDKKRRNKEQFHGGQRSKRRWEIPEVPSPARTERKGLTASSEKKLSDLTGSGGERGRFAIASRSFYQKTGKGSYVNRKKRAGGVRT